ncbi:protein translocase subunit SecF [Patescibacteria group bacterium]|nr:protein translocase subunit SecF [Patescibacteria group bacterium]
MKNYWIYFIISALVIVPGVYSLLRWGLIPGVDFTGGTVVEFRLEGVVIDEALGAAGEIEGDWEASWEPEGEVLRLEGEEINRDRFEEIFGYLEERLGMTPVELEFVTVGPKLGQELVRKTMLAVGLAAAGILVYVGWQFKDWRFGTCAILAMFHDTLILLGCFSLLGQFQGVKVDSLFVTAVLTVLSFSVHDTVVVFDRIRESRKRFGGQPLEVLANKAVLETIVRSLNNSLTIIFMLTSLLFLGGSSIKWFVVALLIGTISGTYSSTFTAVPLLVGWDRLAQKKR